jgi:hypothetical protein
MLLSFLWSDFLYIYSIEKPAFSQKSQLVTGNKPAVYTHGLYAGRFHLHAVRRTGTNIEKDGKIWNIP